MVRVCVAGEAGDAARRGATTTMRAVVMYARRGGPRCVVGRRYRRDLPLLHILLNPYIY